MSLNDAIIGRQQRHETYVQKIALSGEQVVKSGAGVFYGIQGKITTGGPLTLYLQFVDSTTAGATGPNIMHSVPVRQLTSNETLFNIEVPNGIKFSNGLKISLSNTPYGAGFVNGMEYTVFYQ